MTTSPELSLVCRIAVLTSPVPSEAFNDGLMNSVSTRPATAASRMRSGWTSPKPVPETSAKRTKAASTFDAKQIGRASCREKGERQDEEGSESTYKEEHDIERAGNEDA